MYFGLPHFNLDYSLRYATDMASSSTSDDSVPVAYPVSPALYSKFIASEQAFNLVASGLKPNTPHKVFFNDVDVTNLCKQQGETLGSGLSSGGITSPRPFFWSTNANYSGKLSFTFFYAPSLYPGSPFEKAAIQASKLGSPKVLTIRNDDGTSSAKIILSIPAYAKAEPEVIIKKTPSIDNVASKLSVIQNPKSSGETYVTMENYSLVQTFYADPEIVNKSSDVTLTSIDLYFKFKPDSVKNVSGDAAPGVAIAVCEVENNIPILTKTYPASITRKEYDSIFTYADSSTPVTFSFPLPLKLTTGKFYGLVVLYEDPAYELWVNKTGDRLVGTNTSSPGVNTIKDGKLYFRNNSNVFNDTIDTDLKFNIKCAKFIDTNELKTFVNKDYEFLTINNKVGDFLGGEYVYKNKASETGAVAVEAGTPFITGVGTNFNYSEDDNIVVLGAGTDKEVITIGQVVNSTYLIAKSPLPFSNTAASFLYTPTAKVAYKDELANKMYLVDSTANTVTVGKFESNDTIIGIDSNSTANVVSVDAMSVDRLKIKAHVNAPSGSKLNATLKFTSFDGTNYTFSDSNVEPVKINDVFTHNIKSYDGYILSRSLELDTPTLYTDSNLLVNKKSLKAELLYTVNNNNKFSSPSIVDGIFDVFTLENKCSNTYQVSTGGVLLDTEVSGNGIATSRHITTKVKFDTDRYAEDLKVYMVAYRPVGTDIKVYARLYNSADPEAFDDKVWTPLEYTINANKFSSTEDERNFYEYELGIPQFSPSAAMLPGTFTTTNGSAVITYNGPNSTPGNTPNNFVAANDVIKLYSPVFPQNHIIAVVQSANSTTITLRSPITNANVVGDGFLVDTLKYDNMAFNNKANDNIVRYYNNARAEFDTFDTMQIKIVFLADKTYLVPKIDQIQVIGVSA